MGYTHYWLPKVHTKKQWDKFTATCKKLHDNLPEKTDSAGGYYDNEPLEIAGGNGDSNPIFSANMVDFNGRGELSHETFRIYGDPNKNSWDFCKTSRKPYDLLVVACLIAAYQILDFRFSSDGFNSDDTCEDLQSAIDFYNYVVPTTSITQELLIIQRNEYKIRRGDL